MNVLVTGATGFVGRFLCSRLLTEGWNVRGTLLASENPSSLVAGVEPVIVKPLSADTAWDSALCGINTIIHLAARVHVMVESSVDPLAEFRSVNVDGTTQLARKAAGSGVKRFVFISSIKVNGEESSAPYTPDSASAPSDPYGVSKWEAEQALRKIEKETGLDVVVVRPPLIYGPGVKANFLNLMKIIRLSVPLPFASILNKRSLLYVGNLVDALVLCALHPAAAGQTYLVSDGVDVSIPELIRRLADELGAPVLLFPVPVSLIIFIGKLTGKGRIVNRLTGSLLVDSSKIRRELGWTPTFIREEGLAETARWYKHQK